MPNIKTAISIEKNIFDQMESLAKKMRISRSRLFSIAALEYIERCKNLEILDALNNAYDDDAESGTAVTQMRSRHYNLVKDQW